MKFFYALLLSFFLANFAVAKDNPLSVHVLNLQTGLPDKGVIVELSYFDNNKWAVLTQKITDENGRISALYPTDKDLKKGIYKVVFKTQELFNKRKQDTFFPEVPVIFIVENTSLHYHIPLLLSQYGYSTYRGN